MEIIVAVLTLLTIWAAILGYTELHRKLVKGLSPNQGCVALLGFFLYIIPFFWALGLGYREIYRWIKKRLRRRT